MRSVAGAGVVVTGGGGSGIGAALSRRFAAGGPIAASCGAALAFAECLAVSWPHGMSKLRQRLELRAWRRAIRGPRRIWLTSATRSSRYHAADDTDFELNADGIETQAEGLLPRRAGHRRA